MACRSLPPASLAPRWLCSAWGLCIGSREVYTVREADVAALPPLLSAQIPNLGKGEVHLLPNGGNSSVRLLKHLRVKHGFV